MRLLLVGLLVGGVAGYALQRFALGDPQDVRRTQRHAATETPVRNVVAPREGEPDAAALWARIAELEALLAARNGPDDFLLPGGVEVPRTDEAVDLLLEEYQQTDDLDRLLALFRALLLQGERGYPKLTKLILRVVGKGMAGRLKQDELLERVVPALRIAMRHEKELVGYVGYLLANDEVPPMMRTGAMAVAMFLSINRVPGSDAFAPKLLEQFMGTTATAGPGMGSDQTSMLIAAMGLLQQQEAVDPLLSILNDPARKPMHGQAVEALGRIGDPRAVAALVKQLEAGPQENRWWSPELTALARIGTPEATRAAEQYLRGITDPEQFFTSAGSYLQVRPSPAVVEMVATTFRANPGASNMWAVLNGLNRAGTPESLALLQEIANSATQEHVKRRAQSHLDERRVVAESLGD